MLKILPAPCRWVSFRGSQERGDVSCCLSSWSKGFASHISKGHFRDACTTLKALLWLQHIDDWFLVSSHLGTDSGTLWPKQFMTACLLCAASRWSMNEVCFSKVWELRMAGLPVAGRSVGNSDRLISALFPQRLAELLKSKKPEDLQEANRLIKNMVKEVSLHEWQKKNAIT